MITVDTLARELGCTVADIDDLGLHRTFFTAEGQVLPLAEKAIRAEWSERTGIDYTDNELIRATTLAHRVKEIIPAAVSVSVLVCQCGHRLTSNSIVPEAARRRLYKSHAMHVSAALMTIGNDQ